MNFRSYSFIDRFFVNDFDDSSTSGGNPDKKVTAHSRGTRLDRGRLYQSSSDGKEEGLYFIY
jgi:hypothetical protein